MRVAKSTRNVVALCFFSVLFVLGAGCGPSEDGNDLSTDGERCRLLLDCANSCPEEDEECEQACRAEASERAKSRHDAIQTCDETHCSDADFQTSSACFVKNCHQELATCVPEYYGEATCAELFRCGAGYGDGCPQRGSKDARVTNAELSLCMDEHECGSMACVAQKCTDLATRCGITGDSTCREVNVCLKSTEDRSCLEDIAPGESAANMSALEACQHSNCQGAEGLREFVLCTSKNCRTERDNCGLNGSQTTCAEMWGCATGDDDTCANAGDLSSQLFEDYIYEGSAEQQTEFFELSVCVENNCPERRDSCIQGECGDKLDACGVQN